jgi:nucleotide-binding universal stress UspA family protein
MALFKKILVPHDLSIQASAALKVAADLARRNGGRITVLHVLAPFAGGLAFPEAELAWEPPRELALELKRRLEADVAGALGKSVAAKVRCQVVLGEPVRTILAAASKADSIVMTTFGRTGLAHLLMGSVAERVVRQAPVPVLTLRPAARPPATRRKHPAPRRRRST